MAEHTERLDGGLVTSKDPSELSPGELSECTNATYLPNSSGLYRSPGHSLFGTISASSSVQGLVDIKFDNGNHYLIAELSGGTRHRAPVGGTGTWTSLEAVTSGNWLDTLHYQNRYFILNGANLNRVAYLAATSVATTPTLRAHGMTPVNTTPDAVTAAGVFSAAASGWYEYWTTEVLEYVQDGATARLESTFGADPFSNSATPASPKSIQVTSIATQAVRITRPTPADASAFNSGATYWRVYRSAKKENSTDVLFPTGFLLTELPLATDSFLDGVAATATAAASGATSVNVWTASSGSFAVTVASSDNIYAQVTAAGVPAPTMRAAGFSWSTTPTDPIAGIEVLIEAKAASFPTTSNLRVALTNDGGTTLTPFKTVTLSSADTEYTIGGASDNWGFTWTAAIVTSANFQVVVKANFGSARIDVDRVRVRLNFNGTPATSAEVFPAIILDVGGEQSAVGSHGPPPKAYTGDVFEDCLVLNDVDFPSHIRWSLAGEPEYFPWLYFLDFETADNDQVRCIKTLGNRLVVGLNNSLWRVNYLPNEDDAKFSRGKALDLISGDKGIVNPKAACLYTNSAGRVELAFVASTGLYTTDGFTIREITSDIRWTDLFAGLDIFAGGSVELHNDPHKWELKLFLTNTVLHSGTYLYRLHYHPLHIKPGGMMKVSGPTVLTHDAAGSNVRASLVVPRSDGTFTTYLGYKGTEGGGAVYRETGINIPVTNTSGRYTASVKTRNLYLAGYGNEWRLGHLYIHHQAPDPTTPLQISCPTSRTNEADTSATQTLPFTTSFAGFTRLYLNQLAEGITIKIADDSGIPTVLKDWKLDYLILRGEGFGEEGQL